MTKKGIWLTLLGIWFVLIVGLGIWFVLFSQGKLGVKKIPVGEESHLSSKKRTAVKVVEEKKIAPTLVGREEKLSLYKKGELVVGKIVKVQVKGSLTQRPVAADFVFNYDPSILHFQRISKKNFDQVLMTRNDTKNGRLAITLKNDSPKMVESGASLIELEFKVIKKQPTSVSLEFNGPGATKDTNLVVGVKPGEDSLRDVSPKEVFFE